MIDECYHQALVGILLIVAVPVKDTIKRVVNHQVVETPNRSEMYAVRDTTGGTDSFIKASTRMCQ